MMPRTQTPGGFCAAETDSSAVERGPLLGPKTPPKDNTDGTTVSQMCEFSCLVTDVPDAGPAHDLKAQLRDVIVDSAQPVLLHGPLARRRRREACPRPSFPFARPCHVWRRRRPVWTLLQVVLTGNCLIFMQVVVYCGLTCGPLGTAASGRSKRCSVALVAQTAKLNNIDVY